MKDDSLKVKAYFDLFWINYRKNYESSMEYAIAAEELSQELGLSFQLADAHRVKSFSLSGMGRFDEAHEELLEALEIFMALKDKKMIADVKTELGYLSQSRFNFKEALAYYLEALNIVKEIRNKDNEARILNYIGTIHKKQKQYEKAIANYEDALALVQELDFKPGISACLTNLASVFMMTEQYEKALFYHNKSLELKMQMGDKLGQGRVLNNLGVVHNVLKHFDEAEEKFNEAYKLAIEVGDKQLLSDIQYGKIEAAFSKSNYRESIAMANKLLKQSDSLNDLELAVKLHNKLSLSYGSIGDYKKAYLSSLNWHSLSDSLYNNGIISVTNDLEAKYQNEQKTKEIALLASEKELQQLQLKKRENERNSIIAFAFLVFLLAVLAFNQYRIKKKSNRELQELDRFKSNFFANISHEFRTPLTLIKGPIERLEQSPEEQLDTNEIKIIKRNTNKVLSLVNQLLELSTIDQGKLQLKPTEGDVFKCLRVAVASFSSHAAQREMDYRVEIPNEMFWAAFDRDKLEKIVYNLLSNAFKFSDDGEQIAFKAGFKEEKLQIQICDSGRGISKEKLPFIFDRFYQIESGSTREKEGSGIGLSLSKNLIELMDGTITAASEEGKGTFFTVQLPIEKIETGKTREGESESKSRKRAIKSKTYELSKTDTRNLPQILIVEDNADMRQLIKSRLMKNYRVMEETNGIQGFKRAISSPPHLIITDLMMPKMDGLALCKKLKTNIETSHIPIIMLTAKAGVENKIEGLETGADDYLTKPFNASELLVRVNNLITQRNQLRDYYSKDKDEINPSRIATTSIDKKFLEQLLNLLENEHSDADFGVPQMQKSLAMSKTQLHRKLKALTNEAPGELLRNFRLKRAAQLLSQEADTVTQIAYRVGFNNLSYFAKCFKELYGVSPSSY